MSLKRGEFSARSLQISTAMLQGGASSTSSSSRGEVLVHTPPCDDDQVLAARGNPDLVEEVPASSIQDKSAEKHDEGEIQEQSLAAKKDDVPLMKIEAMSTYHLLTHAPKNPYCPACQRAKLQRKPHRNKSRKVPLAERVQAEEFGDVTTGDYIVTIDAIDWCIDNKRDAVVLYDVATGYLDCFPTNS